MALRLFATACNYPGESYALPDCEMDAENVADTLSKWLTSATVLLSRQAPYKKAKAALVTFLYETCKPGDTALVWNSGHGTWKFDSKKKPQQAVVFNDGMAMWEKELHDIIIGRPRGIGLIGGTDSCFGGGLPYPSREFKLVPTRTVRTVPSQLVKFAAFNPKRIQRGDAYTALYLPCQPDEYSYSTGEGGAMTIDIMNCFRRIGDSTTLHSLYTQLRKNLPTKEWPQTPMWYCPNEQFAKRTIKSFAK